MSNLLKPSVSNEFDPLRRVILGTAVGLKSTPDPNLLAGLPKTSKRYDQPNQVVTGEEFRRIKGSLEAAGVQVDQPTFANLPEVVDQTCPRDIGFVIDGLYFQARSKYQSRNSEHRGIDHLIDAFDPACRLTIPDGAFLEGGDVVLAPGRVFCGLGARSNREGIDWLAETFKQYGIDREIIVVPHDVLHLDCCWNVINPDLALWSAGSTESFRHLSGASFKMDYETITINQKEQAALATNVLVITPDHLIARDDPICERVNQSIEHHHKIRVERIHFDSVPSIGGSFRCATLPLIRN